MKGRTIVLFEDVYSYHFYPFALLRPVCDLVAGMFSLYRRLELLYPDTPIEILCRPELEDLVRESGRTVFSEAGFRHAERYVFINARAVFDARHRFEEDSCCLEGDNLVWLHVAAGRLDDWCIRDVLDGECVEKTRQLGLDEKKPACRLYHYSWELANGVARGIESDCAIAGLVPGPLGLPGVTVLGDRFVRGEGAVVDPGCLLDSREGPVIIGAGAKISRQSVIAGPAVIGEGASVDAGRLHGGVAIGRQCRVGGEIESTVMLDWSNKHHDGFLGHAYVGSWVNIGAMTTNSDLRNDYGEIKVRLEGREIHSGQIKLGCLIGDHVKLGIGLLLNTGVVIGPCANLYFEGGLISGEVPGFVWGGQAPYAEYRINKFFDTLQTVMGRRGQKPGDAMRRRIVDLFAELRGSRLELLRPD